MIEKVFRCDLCGRVVLPSPPSRDPPAYRIAFKEDGAIARFAVLTDNQASEKLLCGRCIAGLRAALEIKDLTWEKS